MQALRCNGHEFLPKSLQLGKLLLRIDANALCRLAHQIAQHTLQKGQVLVEDRGGRQAQRCLFDARPGLAQVSDVVEQLFVAGVFGIGAQNEAASGRPHQSLHPLAQRIALLGRYFLRYTNVVVLRQKHQMAARNADLRRQAGSLGAHRVLDDLHHDGAALEHLLFNGHQRLARAGGCGLAFGVLLPDIGHMQKSRFVQANVDEGRLHARQHSGHFAQEHIAHQAALERALDMQLLHSTQFDHRDPRFLG